MPTLTSECIIYSVTLIAICPLSRIIIIIVIVETFQPLLSLDICDPLDNNKGCIYFQNFTPIFKYINCISFNIKIKQKRKKKKMAEWHSMQLKVLYEVLGWVAFVAWSISFYPQVIMNFRRKSVVGLNFDFVILNLTKHSSYLIYNVVLYFSASVQAQYRHKFGANQMIPVAANDVAFSIHAVLLTAFTLFQIFIYERKNQRFSKAAIGIVCAVWLSAAVCTFVAIHRHTWFWLITVFNTIQVIMTVIKYVPQAIMNFRRKSTDGFSIGNILLDLTGGVTNYGQMAMQSIDQKSWVNFYGNIGKTLLSLVSIFFDILFIIQHYVLYPASKKKEQQLPIQSPSSEQS